MDPVIDPSKIKIDEETIWKAIQAHDVHFDGDFVYAVRSTGIYCPAGLPFPATQAEQVVFFASCNDAEQAGYRPCKRCRPGDVLSPSKQVQIVQRACRLIDERIEAAPTLAELSRLLAISPSHLHRLFKTVTGLTPHQYASGQKLERFKTFVKEGDDLTGALYQAGYGSSSRLYENAGSRLGMTPGSYQKGGKGMEIRYTIVDSFIGRMLVAATDRGVCAVSFGEKDAPLEAFLREEYPNAGLQRDEASLRDWVDALLNHLDGSRPHLDLPIDVQATAFQLQVWDELRRIPYGETRTYTEVAQAVGRPKAVRAVANACAANPAAVVNPCHRVLRSDGGLGGYRWGIERKEALLARERGR